MKRWRYVGWIQVPFTLTRNCREETKKMRGLSYPGNNTKNFPSVEHRSPE